MNANKAKVIPAKMAKEYPLFSLTQEQRHFEKAVEKARAVQTDLWRVIDTEIKQLTNGINIEVDINLCQGTGLDLWLKEPGRLMLGCSLINDNDEQAFLAIDYVSAYQLADLCLGGQITSSLEPSSCSELSATECRVSGRLLHRTILGIQQRLSGEKSALPANKIEKPGSPSSYAYLPFKVRIIMEQDAVSWFLWLPTTLFAPLAPQTAKDKKTTLLSDSLWLDFPVKGRVEMAHKSISLSQLKACMQGQILPIEMSAEALFKLDKKILFKGRVAEENNSLAFQITQTKELAK